MSLTISPPACLSASLPRKFTSEDHERVAGWFAAPGGTDSGYDVALGTCDDGLEWLGVAPPGSRDGDLWLVSPAEGGGFDIVSANTGQWFCHAADMLSALRFVAPVPPGLPEPLPLPGGGMARVEDYRGAATKVA